MLPFDLFYRRYGIRNISLLQTPVMHNTSIFILPLNSIIHHCDYSGVSDGPSNNELEFKGMTKSIQVEHVLELTSNINTPRKINIVLNKNIRDYHILNKRTKWLRHIDSISKDQLSLIVFNYSLILKSYKYVKSFYTNYYKWYNLFSTITTTISTINTIPDRNHFIKLKIPKVIPGLIALNLASSKEHITQQLLSVFKDEESAVLLELWKLLSDDINIIKSSLFSNIPLSKMHLVNLIYVEGNQFTILNIGTLLSYLDSNKDNKELVIKSKFRLNNIQLQKRLLKMMMSIMEIKTLSIVQDLNVDIEEVKKNEELANIELAKSVLGDGVVLPENKSINIQDNIDSDDEDYSKEDEVTTKSRLEIEDKELDAQIAQLNEISKKQENVDLLPKKTLANLLESKINEPLESGIMDICDDLASNGLLSANEYKRMNSISVSYKKLITPSGENMYEYSKVSPDLLLINDSNYIKDKDTVLDKSMLKSSLSEFDSKYIKNVLNKDIFASVLSIHKAGVAVTGYDINKVTDVLGEYETHTLTLQPVVGKKSTIRFKIPVIKEDGSYRSNNVKYRIRKQRGDLPIRKIESNIVALTTYYGKSFVTRSRKKTDDYGHWLTNQIMIKALENKVVTKISNNNVFNQFVKTPRSYSALSKSIKSLTCKGYDISFDYDSRLTMYPLDILSKLEKYGSVVFGKKNNEYLVLDIYNTVYISNGDNTKVLGNIEQLFDITEINSPVEYAEVGIYGKDIPVGVILSYYMGLSNLLKLLNVKPRIVEGNTRLNLAPHEWSIEFNDDSLVFNKDDRLVCMILGGFNSYYKAIKQFSIYSFDKKGVYLNLLESAGLSTRYLRELDLMDKMFVDPISLDILLEMKEPTNLRGLLIRSCELLLSDDHPDALDPKFMRIKGYERISGAIYAELIQSLRYHDSRLGKANVQIELNPYSVWKRISEDPSKSILNEINPIESLKEVEAVTFSGTGGRNKRSMVKSSRIYHENDVGTISESTIDSGDVGINVFTSANPRFNSLRGMSDTFKHGEDGYSSILSTSALLAPGSVQDDPKRVNFVAIQASHSIACKGYHQFTVRTGYDSVIADRTYDLFAFTAKKPGVVKSIDKKGIIIEYEDKEVTGYELGRRYGEAAGLTIPHNVITQLSINDKVVLGDVIVYNDGFFEPDLFNNKHVVLKNSINVTTVLWESYQTLEDASSISTRVAERLMTKITKVKNILVTFDQSITNIVKVGDIVDADSVLCFIEDSVTSNNNLFNNTSIDTLRTLSAQTPKALVKGVIEKIEIYYHGDREDLSPSLKELADISDKQLKTLSKSLNTQSVTGSVDGGMMIDKTPMSLDTCAIKIYITSTVGAGTGDKGVFCNQLKTVFSEILKDDIITEDGTLIDCVFGSQSVANRIVNSPYIIGTTNTLLKIITQKALAMYKK